MVRGGDYSATRAQYATKQTYFDLFLEMSVNTGDSEPSTALAGAPSPAPARESAGADPGAGAGRIQSVERAARILLAFAAPEQEITVAELARMLDVHKSTASRLVATLLAYGLLARGGGDDDRLRLGPELARLGRYAASGPNLVELARPAMDDLTAVTGEGSTLAIVEDGVAVTVAQSAGNFVIGAQPWVGLHTPLHATSDGKVLLAYGAAPYDGEPLERCTEITIVDPDLMVTELASIRTRGWATSGGEFELGLHGVAAPVFDADGRCCAAICISGPSYRITEADLDRLGTLCRQAADRVTAALSVDGSRGYAYARAGVRS
jgi:DNA-binding IclR family transcriptional regulator